jgi:nitroimidazol reductase NimA-like FMN-containing flavoprotein (pyridoxamine 5'-phosphate oxidase superfamily)
MRRKDRELTGSFEMEQVISKADVCRIALADNNIPYIVTMNFGYSGGENACFYFHCAREGRKLDMIRKNNYVCFELDTDHQISEGEKGCDWGMTFSSIVGYGYISILEDRDSRNEALDTIMSHYSDRKTFSYDERVFDTTTILRLDISGMTAKRKV